MRPLPGWLAAALVFFASGSVLVLEVVALRLIGPYVGITLQTSSSVIGVALAAIAYGAWVGGWLADRLDPRRLLAPALVLAGIASAVTLPLVRFAGEGLRGEAAGAILLLAAIAVIPPAGLLSAVTPLVVKLQLGDLRRTGQVVGRLSGVGTLGGITATLGTGFILVAAVPSSAIVMGLAVLLVAGGLAVGFYLYRQQPAPLADRSGRAGAVIAVVGLAGAGLAAVAPDPCDVETAYHCAEVRTDPARPSGRELILNSARHSYVDLADPRHLEFAYVQWIAATAELVAPAGRPIDALHLGGGGFTVPNYLAATRPGTRSTVLELDGALVELDRRRLGLRTGPDLRVVVGDARVHLRERPDAGADLIVGDAFGHLVVPWHLATRQMAADIRRALRPGGLYAQNVIDYPTLGGEPGRFIRAEVATVRAAFPHVLLVAPPAALNGETSANFVIVAAGHPIDRDALQRQVDRFGSEPATVLSESEVAAFAGNAAVLTDDHAPVDQLLVAP